jgi:hypothetical protein
MRALAGALSAAVLAALGLVVPGAGGAGPSETSPDAELLLNLDMLKEATFTRDSDLYRKMNFLERLRLLEALKFLESQSPAPTAATPVPTDSKP